MRRGLMMGALLAGAGLFEPARASAIEFGTPKSEHPFRTSQNFAVELRFGPYYPGIDNEPGLRGKPFANSFGTDKRILAALELDWQTYRIPYVGTIGPGVGIGTTSFSADSKTLSDGSPSGDETGLTIYPIWAVAVLRADAFWREVGVPFVPYGKAGFALAPWRATSTGETSNANGIAGKGTTYGTYVSIGVMLALDMLDAGAGRNLDIATGINGTYIFAEYYALGLNGIGQSNPLRVGATTWCAGLAFEF